MELGKLYVTIAADTKRLTAGLAKAKGEIAKTTAGMGAHFKTMGIGMAVAGAAITAAFGLTIKSAMAFEAELAQVSTMLDDVSMKHMPEFKSGLQSLAMEFGESTSTLSKGLYDILSASIDPAKALDVLAVASKAATAGITDTGVAADAITTILNSYGLEAEDAGIVSDKLFAIVKRGKTTFAELAPAIGTVAATASMAGLSFDDLGAAIATVTRAGINTNAAMTAINGVLKAFLKPQIEAVNLAWDKFKLKLDTTTLKAIGLTGVMEKLKDATAEELAQIFGSIRGLKGMAAALGDLEGYIKDHELMMKAAGLTQEAFDKQSATLKFQLGRLKQGFIILITTIGEKFLPIMKGAADILIKITGVMKKWMDAHPTLTKAIVILTAALGVLVGAGGIIILATLAFVKMKIALLALKGAFIAIGKTLLLLTGPIGWVVAAVGALYLAWTTNFIGIRDFTLKIVNELKPILASLADYLRGILEKLGLYQEVISSDSGGGGAGAFGEELDEMGTKADDAKEGLDDLKESVEGLGDGFEKTKDKIDEFGNFVETFDEWMERLAKESAEANAKLADAAEDAYKRYEDAMQPIEDRLYELTHTEEEVAARKLQLEREKMEATIEAAELGHEVAEEALRKVKEVYDKELGFIIAKMEEKKQKEIETAKTTEETGLAQAVAIDKITREWDDAIAKIDAYADKLRELAKIKAQQTVEALPTINETGYVPDYIPEGEEGFARGTPFVKKTGLVKVHKGEAILPEKVNPFGGGASSNIFNNQKTERRLTYSPNVNVNVEGDGDPWAIKKATKEALDESAVQFGRRGSWIMPGG